MTRNAFESLPDAPEFTPAGIRRVARVVKGAMGGKINAVTDVTLTANATTTTINDRRIGPESFISLTPTTANASAVWKDTYVSSRGQFTATITHPSDANTDKTFVVLIVG